MSDKDDPFGLSSEAGRTRIRPAAGAGQGRPVSPSAGQTWGAPPPPAQAPAFGGFDRGPSVAPGPARPRGNRPHANPLVAAFAPLLELAPELERAQPPGQPEVLRQRVQGSLIDARDAAVALGQPLTRANQGAWFVAALIDDIALNTPWGGHSDWPRQPLVTALTGEVDAGTRFFRHVEELVAYPNRDPDLLELAYICLGLGFRGQYRLQGPTGEAAITALRGQIARLMRNVDTMGAPLSPHADGVKMPDEPRRFAVPLWTVWLVAVALIAGIYTALSLQLGNKAEQLFVSASALPPAERAGVFRPIRDTAVPEKPVEPLEPVIFELSAAFPGKGPARDRRRAEGARGCLGRGAGGAGRRPGAVSQRQGRYPRRVRAADRRHCRGDPRKRRGDRPDHRDRPYRLGPGAVERTRSSRTRASAKPAPRPSPNCWSPPVVPADQVVSEGRADTEPVGDNATKEGRAQNRRIEIKIEKRL